jgi:DNA-binding transcriptional ArsR family regulator
MGRKARHELDNIIVKILEYRKSLKYTELFEEINRLGETKRPIHSTVNEISRIGDKPDVQWKKLHSTTFDRRLRDLEQTGVLDKEYKGINTYYSLTKNFKHSLDRRKQEHPTTYIERTLQQFRIQYASELESDDDEKAIEIIKPSESEESPEDKKI